MGAEGRKGGAMRINAGVYGVLLAVGIPGVAGAAGPRGVVVEVEAGPHARKGTPVLFTLPDALKDARTVRLTQLQPTSVVAAQVLPGERPCVIWILDSLPAGATRSYRLEAADPASPDP